MSPRSKAPAARLSGAPWPKAKAPVALGELERACLVVVMTLRRELGREPTPDEVAKRLGVRSARPLLDVLDEAGLLHLVLTGKQLDCLTAIYRLEAALGRSPSTGEVSAAMGLSPGGSRFHINNLVSLGLATKPEVVLVLRVTSIGRAFLPAAGKAS